MEKKLILISAGDAITAKLIKEAGFDGIWISGFEASARLGLSDNGSITLTEMVAIAKTICDAVDLPVYVVVDTGYGNFKRTVKEFEKIGVAGICVEDNLPNKENSLWGGPNVIMPMKNFIEKIDIPHRLTIIARTEALIRGYGMTEAIQRAVNYAKVADMILVHTRAKDEKEAFAIARQKNKIGKPLVIVPTKFPQTTNLILEDMGYDMIIWANQTERVKIRAIRIALESLKMSDCAKHIEQNLSATLDDMKNLTPDELGNKNLGYGGFKNA